MPHEMVMPKQSVASTQSDYPACQGGLWQKGKALLRLAKPGIVLAELTAVVTGMALASAAVPSVAVCIWTLLVVSLAAGGAAMANGLIDATSDRLMPRLAARSQALHLVGERLVVTVSTGCMGLAVFLAAILLNVLTSLFLCASIVSYLWLYTAWQKRRSSLAVLVGGIPGALPPLIGAAAVGSLSAAPVLLALVMYLWQMPHFWFLALQYQEQYRRAGVPVFPLVHGEQLTKRLILVSIALLVPLTMPFCLFVTAAITGTLVMLLNLALLVCSAWALQGRTNYRQGFYATLVYLALLFAVLIADTTLGLT